MSRSHGASALPESEALRQFLEQDQTPVGVAEILRAFDLPLHLKRSLRVMLQGMAMNGALTWLPAGRLKTMPDMPDMARVRITARREDGTTFAQLASDPNIRVRLVSALPDGTLLLPGDLVSVKLRPPAPPHTTREGRPMSLLIAGSRDIPACIDTIEADELSVNISLHPCDKRLSLQLQLTLDQHDVLLPQLTKGSLVTVRLLSLDKNGLMQVRLCSLTEKKSARDMAAHLSIQTYNLPENFSSEALHEAQQAQDTPLPSADSQRKDLRTLRLVTIDDETAQDFDDALWAERTEQGFHLVVAIADVSYYVPAGSALDRDAQKRGTSVYLSGYTIPMLPPALSANLCSLRPDEDRLCIALDLHISSDGTLLSGSMQRAVMRSAARLTYNQVQHCLDTSAPPYPEAPHVLTDDLHTLFDVSAALGANMRQRGADSHSENKSLSWTVIFDETGSPASFTQRPHSPARELVANCMIATNQFIAQEMQKLSAQGLFRVHAGSSQNKYGSDRIMARYTPSANVHHGLALPLYTHFTSPIRRYTDLINHQILTKTLDYSTQIRDDETSRLALLAEHLNFTEKRASSATQDCLNRLAAIYLTPSCGQLITACVTRKTHTGIALILTKTGSPSFVSSDCLLNYSGFYDDSFPLCASPHTWSALQTGSTLSVVLTATDPSRGTFSVSCTASDKT